MSPFFSTACSLLMLTIGLVEVGLMFYVQGRGVQSRERWVLIHRFNGYAFISIFLLMFGTMVLRLESFWETSSPRIDTHVTLAVMVFFLLMVKTAIARYFRKLLGNVFEIGLIIYTLSFALVGITAGYYLVYRIQHRPYISHHQTDAGILDLELGKQLFIQQCSTCHVLQQIMQPRTEHDWERVVNDMVVLAHPRIKPDEAAQILNYVIRTLAPKPLAAVSAGTSLVGRHCLGCHKATDIFTKSRTAVEWRLIVVQMSQMAPEQVPANKIDAIVNELTSDERSHYLPPVPMPPPPAPPAPIPGGHR